MRGLGLFAISVVVVALALLPGATPFFQAREARAETMIFGDANCDGSVSATDAITALRLLTGEQTACVSSLADVNCSGGVDISDVVMLRRHEAGLPGGASQGCPAIGSSLNLTGPSSTERIEEALANGAITKGQALLYHLYAELGDSRLPFQYRGPANDDMHAESAILQEIATVWPTLSQPERDALMPFLLPPSEPGSWVEQGDVGFAAAAAVQWETVSNDRIKVWWQTRRPEDAAKAAAILDELDSYIWPEVVGYMGEKRAPLKDAEYKGNGGDSRYDVYLVHNAPHKPDEKPVLGWVSPMATLKGEIRCDVTPTYMVLNSRAPISDVFFSTVAHEFMHSVQFTYDVGSCDDYRWLMESTATWVESWLYSETNQEHGFANAYVAELDKKPLEDWTYKDPRQYGSYLLWYHAQQNENMFYAVRDAWNASSDANSLMAVNTGLAGKLRDVWPQSALFNWNREPYDDFMVGDQLLAMAPWKDKEVTAGNAPTSYAVPTDVGHMQQRHLNFTIGSDVKTLTFINPFGRKSDYWAKVQAIVQINGQWQPKAVDWTAKDRVSFCFDRPEEKVTQLVLVITNSNYFDRSYVLNAGPGELVASPNGCKGWVGSASAEIPYLQSTFKITVDNLRFAPVEDMPGNARYDFYELVEAGDATWTVSGMWDDCEPTGTMTLKPPKVDNASISGIFHVDKYNNTYDTSIVGNTYEDSLTLVCPTGSMDRSWPVAVVLNIGSDWPEIPGDGHLSGEYREQGIHGESVWRWDFTMVE